MVISVFRLASRPSIGLHDGNLHAVGLLIDHDRIACQTVGGRCAPHDLDRNICPVASDDRDVGNGRVESYRRAPAHVEHPAGSIDRVGDRDRRDGCEDDCREQKKPHRADYNLHTGMKALVKAWTTATRLACLLVVCSGGDGRRPDAPVRADRARRRPGHARRRRVGDGRLDRSGLLQLHRLRALGAADAAPRHHRRRSRPAITSSFLGELRTRERRHRRSRTRSTCASGRGRTGTSTSRSAACRRPSAPSRGAPTRPTTRSSATRSPTST